MVVLSRWSREKEGGREREEREGGEKDRETEGRERRERGRREYECELLPHYCLIYLKLEVQTSDMSVQVFRQELKVCSL